VCTTWFHNTVTSPSSHTGLGMCVYHLSVVSIPKVLHIVIIITITYLLTYSMVQSPSWTANCFADSQENPRISRNPKVHYRTHKSPPPVSILGQPNPVHIPTSHLLEIHPNIIHLSTPRSPQWSPSLRFPHQDTIHSPLLIHTCHMTSPSHSSWLLLLLLLLLSLLLLLFRVWL
jgi:hypothetical protein